MERLRLKTRLACLGLAALLAGCGAPQPAPVPAPTPAAPAATVAPDGATETLLQAMTLQEKIGQLFFIRPDALDLSLMPSVINDASFGGVTALSAEMRAALAQYPVGGVVVFGKNIRSPGQLTGFLAELQGASAVPLLAAVDEEGGAVARLANHPAFAGEGLPAFGSMAQVGAQGPEAARAAGQAIGEYLKKYGFQLDFAPVADVNTNPDNPVIGTRAFAGEAAAAAELVGAAVEGFHEGGVLCCLKHYPGHGDTETDTHYGAASIQKSWAELLGCELLPFASGIAAGADCVMAAHITAPNAVETGALLPASLNYELLTQKLRGELGFTGVIVTDSLSMQAITDQYAPGEAAVLALQAGADVLLLPQSLPEAFAGVEQAVQDGRLSEARIEQSVRRILTLKQKAGLLG